MTEAPVFQLENKTTGYNGRPVLTDISLEINKGEKIALIGKSGSGKSTLLSLLYRQQTAQTALIPQEPGLVRTLSVFHNTYMGRLDYNAWPYNIINLVYPLPAPKATIIRLLKQLDLADKTFCPVNELSGGEQQRTAIARALYRDSKILLGDEPVSSIDEHQAGQLIRLLTASHETVILALHDVALALACTDRVIGLQKGRIALDAPATSLQSGDLISLYQDH